MCVTCAIPYPCAAGRVERGEDLALALQMVIVSNGQYRSQFADGLCFCSALRLSISQPVSPGVWGCVWGSQDAVHHPLSYLFLRKKEDCSLKRLEGLGVGLLGYFEVEF